MSREQKVWFGLALLVLLLNVPMRWCVVRWDLTQDGRYTLHEPSLRALEAK